MKHIYGEVPDDTIRHSTPTADQIKVAIACLTDPYARYKYYIKKAKELRQEPKEEDEHS